MPRDLSEFQAHQALDARAQQAAAERFMQRLTRDEERARWAQVLAPRVSPQALDLEPLRYAIADALGTQGAAL